MLLPKLDTILLGNQFFGIELFTHHDEEGVALICVEKKKEELLITNKEKRNSFENLVGKPNKNAPVFLVINNTQLIQKEVDGNETIDSKIVFKAFPNIKTDDFYFEIWRLESSSIISICRKNYVDDLLAKYKNFDVSISGISLGITSFSQIKEYFEKDIVKTNSQLINFQNQGSIVSEINDSLVKTYDFNGLEIQNTYLLAFSNVLQKIIKSNKTTGSIIDLNRELSDNYNQTSFFRKSIRSFVFVLLALLLVNFFVFDHYYKKSNEAASSISSNSELIKKIKFTKDRLQVKENKLKNAVTISNSKSSYFINELLKDIPENILLVDLTFNSLDKKIKENEFIKTEENVITVSGVSSSSLVITDWIEQLNAKKVIKKTTVIHFGKNETNENVFTLKINLDTDETK